VIQLQYAPDHAKRRVRVKMQGTLAPADNQGSVDERITEGTWGYSVLYDMGETGSVATSEDVGRVIRCLWTLEVSLGCSSPVAIVSRSRRAPSINRDNPEVDDNGRALRFFGDVDDAERWLDQQLSAASQIPELQQLDSPM
jgi:hypothetical protein